ncbi:hypothetical protein FPJ27_07975 [Burkholderia sp. MS455]|uniref:Uncharacterized protein n=1 Tax=Burkholderia cepacia TaxID=292 RepID=A0A2S8IJB3_BURCE|nr:hypothetical protein C5615_24980 [Burkholderia cepacia]QRR06375.1 hypothetical protein FPJ27_07975 [Burkholderia sp. MS455]TDA46287.1 hypothetical protein EVG18_16785 [Burkholderia pyrrocinia]
MITNSLRPASGAVTDTGVVSGAAFPFASGDLATIVVPRLALVSCAGSPTHTTDHDRTDILAAFPSE